MRLRSEQKRFVEYAFDEIKKNKFFICEAPTAFGKTISALALAKKLINDDPSKRVVIATSSNSLAKEILTEAGMHDLPSYVLGIGKSNYLDIAKVLGGVTLDLDREKVLDAVYTLRGNYGFVFIDEFLDKLDVVDQAKRDFYKDRLSLEESNKEDFLPYSIQITNYSYLLLQIMYGDYQRLYNPENTYFIFDEVQEFINLAELTLNSKFSLFSYYINVKSLHDKLMSLDGSTCPVSLRRAVAKEFDKADELYRLHAKPSKANRTITIRSECVDKARAIRKVLFEGDFEKSVRRLLEKYSIAEARYMLNVIEEGKSTLSSDDIYMTYSKDKGFLSFHTYTKNINGLLANRFWDRIENFCGVTATAFTSADKLSLDPYTRIGINLKPREFSYEDKLTGEKATHEISGKKDKLKFIKTFKGILSPEQANCHINPNEYIEDDEERFEKYATFISHKAGESNSMVLVGGYDEVEILNAKLSKLTKANITVAAPNRSVTNVLSEFKKRGGILIATRNYATGVNLPGSLLEKLFITKLPYPIFATKKWLDLKERNPNMYWFKINEEMVLTFRQAIGRLIRTPIDRGELYILDGRYNAKKIKGVLNHFVEKVATIK